MQSKDENQMCCRTVGDSCGPIYSLDNNLRASTLRRIVRMWRVTEQFLQHNRDIKGSRRVLLEQKTFRRIVRLEGRKFWSDTLCLCMRAGGLRSAAQQRQMVLLSAYYALTNEKSPKLCMEAKKETYTLSSFCWEDSLITQSQTTLGLSAHTYTHNASDVFGARLVKTGGLWRMLIHADYTCLRFSE